MAEKLNKDAVYRAAIQRLATLSPMDYDRVRGDEAKALRVRPATLDKQIAAHRKESQPDQEQDIFTVPDPWHEEVGAAELLDGIANTIKRFIVWATPSRQHVSTFGAQKPWRVSGIYQKP
ncbi:MAG: hypothetical protein PHR16_13300 [Methylovulum sp.]|nr:hypothetical protein [Methylovulum sp.]